MRRPQSCLILPSVSREARRRTLQASYSTVGAEPAVVPDHNQSRTIENVKTSLSSVLDPRMRFSIVMDDQQFLSIYKEARAANDMQRAYRVAAGLIKSGKAPSGLVWQCALSEKIDSMDVSGFSSCYRLMLASQHRLDLDVDDNYYLWQEAIEMAWTDQECIDILFEHAKASNTRKSQIYVFVMENTMDRFKADRESILAWHSRLLQNNFFPDEHGQIQVVRFLTGKHFGREFLATMSTQFVQAGLKVDLDSLSKKELYRQEQTKRIAQIHGPGLVLNKSSTVTNQSFESLLRRHVKYSDHATTIAFIDSLLRTNLKLSLRAQRTIGYFYGSVGNFDRCSVFCKLQYGVQYASKEDAFCAAAVKGAIKSGQNLPTVLQALRIRGARIGQETLQSCVEMSQSLAESQQFIKYMLSENMQVTLRAYAVFIRHVARAGDVKKAQDLLGTALGVNVSTSVSEKDATYLRRGFMLGLLEGGWYEALEATHDQWCSRKLDRAETWNLLIRSRTVDRRVQQALQALREMEKLSLVVENATAQELMGAILRKRRPGRNPNVIDVADSRSYLQDIKTAISVGHKCLQLGGRTQPETWREVMKRLSLYGEFDALGVLTDWLIPQYSLDQSKSTIKRYYIYTADQQSLSSKHPQHPLSRLIRNRDISAVMTRGFVNDKPLEALTQIAKWHSMGVNVDPVAVKKRIEVGLKFLRQDLEMPAAHVEDIASQLRPVFRRITTSHVIQDLSVKLR